MITGFQLLHTRSNFLHNSGKFMPESHADTRWYSRLHSSGFRSFSLPDPWYPTRAGYCLIMPPDLFFIALEGGMLPVSSAIFPRRSLSFCDFMRCYYPFTFSGMQLLYHFITLLRALPADRSAAFAILEFAGVAFALLRAGVADHRTGMAQQ